MLKWHSLALCNNINLNQQQLVCVGVKLSSKLILQLLKTHQHQFHQLSPQTPSKSLLYSAIPLFSKSFIL